MARVIFKASSRWPSFLSLACLEDDAQFQSLVNIHTQVSEY
jgi:hypothetical protein